MKIVPHILTIETHCSNKEDNWISFIISVSEYEVVHNYVNGHEPYRNTETDPLTAFNTDALYTDIFI